MANLAEANGRAYVDYEVYEQDPKLFDSLLNQLNAGRLDEYGIYITSVNENEIEFEGVGRWTMGNTIEDILNSKKLSILSQVAALIRENKEVAASVQENDGLLHFEYDEYEPGCEILRAIELAYSFDKTGKPVVTQETMNDYQYSKRMIKSLEFMSDDDL